MLKLANKISRKKMGSKKGITIFDPEYKILAPVVTQEMAEIALHLEFRIHQTAEDIALLSGKDVDYVHEKLLELSDAGVSFVNTENGKDVFWHDTWIPGVMEMMANNLANVEKHPDIAVAFNDYGIVHGPQTAGAFPVGKGLMRVIPIETAINAETRRADYEEISKYLNDNEVFSVSDCACRTARESMGEGCGHLKEDMCIQLGHAAEYYIRTGRGKAITREEAFDIISKAEENGLMHQIPNLDGSGKTHAICNCCGCGCFSLRSAEMFYNADMVRSNYVAVVNEDKCTGCAECVDYCPTNAVKAGQSLCSKTPLPEFRLIDTPRDTDFTLDMFNENYRYNRQQNVESGGAPCKSECPAHISIPAYIQLAAEGKYKEALKLIKKSNPFPAVCGRICPRLCEQACTLGMVDDPVAIDDIKKFIAEQDMHAEHRYIPEVKHDYKKKIAVIGSGPSGLTCAYYLAVEGYKVTVFEKESHVGGMMMYGIPAFRLQKDVIEAEIDILREIGVEFKTNTEIGKDITISELRSADYEAFYLAIGAQKSRNLGLENEDKANVTSAVDFLKKVNMNEQEKLSGHVIVIGGGNVAIDVARAATRLGADQVSMFALESRENMPALEEEILEAIEEGVDIYNGWGPKELNAQGDKVSSIVFKKCLSTLNAEGRFSPVYDEEELYEVETSTIILSIGQMIDSVDFSDREQVEIRPNKAIIADKLTLQTSVSDIFAGGDAVTGPRFAVDAIAAGKQAAISIHRFVNKGQSLTIGRFHNPFISLDKDNLEEISYDHIPRQHAAHDESFGIHKEFRNPTGVLTEDQIKLETSRCLKCGQAKVDPYMCVGCGQCTTKCQFDAITLKRVYDEEGVTYIDLKKHVVKNILKRKVKVAVKKVKVKFSGKRA